jgi:hypothetical protein
MISKRAVWVVVASLFVLASAGGLCLLDASAAGQVADSHMGSELVISANNIKEFLPSVAYNWKHHEFLVVWHNTWPIGTRDIRAVRVSETGQVLTEFVVYENATKDSAQPSVAYDPVNDRYLVVWVFDSSGANTDWDLYGRFIPWDGPSAGLTDFYIITWTTSQWSPVLAYARTMEEFLVVWTNTYSGGSPPAYISAKRIYADGSGFPSAPNVSDLTLSDATYNYKDPDLTYNITRNEYLLVWQKMVSSNDIWAVRLTGDLYQLSGGPFGIAEWPDSEEKPAVAACKAADQYLVLWKSDVGTGGANYNIYGRFVTGDGNLDGGPILIDGILSPEIRSDLDCTMSGKTYLVAYEQAYVGDHYGILGALISSDHSIQPAVELMPASWTDDRTNPSVAGGYSNFLTVWEHETASTSVLDIHGRLLIPEANFMPLVVKR